MMPDKLGATRGRGAAGRSLVPRRGAASSRAQAPDGPEWLHEIKFDGSRWREEGSSQRTLRWRKMDSNHRSLSAKRSGPENGTKG